MRTAMVLSLGLARDLLRHYCRQESVRLLQDYPVPDCDVWFVRFSLDFAMKTLAIGMGNGWKARFAIALIDHEQGTVKARSTFMTCYLRPRT